MISHLNNSNYMSKYLIGLSGNICSGKSKAAEFFKCLGAKVIDLDKVTHYVYQRNLSLKFKIYKTFGRDIFDWKLKINRKRLGEIVFSDEKRRKKLEEIVWPYVEKKRKKIISKMNGIIIIESALLFESGLYNNMNKNIFILVDEPERVIRLMKREDLTQEEALKRIKTQVNQKEKQEKADYIIYNNCCINSLKRKVKYTWENILGDLNSKVYKEVFHPLF